MGIGIILGTWLISFYKLGLIDKLLLKHVGLPHVLGDWGLGLGLDKKID